MPEIDLHPIPFETLVARMERELATSSSLYTIPRRSWWTPVKGRDISVRHFGKLIDTPCGPASGPHSQMAQNLVMSYLCGGRFMELKTVQINDELEIPRPCIFVPHVGYNVEWSQELRVHESALEYAKGWMLIHYLTSELGPGMWDAANVMFDTSLGYDLDGMKSDKVSGFLKQMRQSSGLIDELRNQLPNSLSKWAGVDVPTEISNSVTISTFHGCPAHEIEAIASQCIEWGVNTVVKLNPTLLGYERCRSMMDSMGYSHIRLDRGAFEKDLSWRQLKDMLPRLRSKAANAGLGFGVKLSNTLVCESEEPPFGKGEIYLSGPPLHVLAMTLSAEIRAMVGPELPITFSAGIDSDNFHSTVEAGLSPVTTCSDLLKGRGYARMTKYMRTLESRMDSLDVSSIDDLKMDGCQAESPRKAAMDKLLGLAKTICSDDRYHSASNSKAPKKIDSALETFDCLTCDKCIPVCPNAANFAIDIPAGSYAAKGLSWGGGTHSSSTDDDVVLTKRHQIGTVADICNLCGQCDPWCPESGGPYIAKPNIFLDAASFDAHTDRHGFWVSKSRDKISWRDESGIRTSLIQLDDGVEQFQVESGSVSLKGSEVISVLGGGEISGRQLTTLRLMLEGFQSEKTECWLP
jgi:putative selenate reductase